MSLIETQADVVLLLRTAYAGILVMTFGQTYHLFLCIQAFRHAKTVPHKLAQSRRPYMVTMIAILVFSAVAYLVDMLDKGALFTTGMEITSETTLPPDPLWWHIAAPLAIGGTHLAGDGLLVWRTRVLYKSTSHIWALLIFVYIGSFGLLIAHIALSSKWALTEDPDGFLLMLRIQTAYFISSVGVNVLSTTLIGMKLWSFKSRVEKALNGISLKSQVPYLRIAGILIESALPFTIFGVACAVSSALFENLAISTQTHAAYHLLWPMWVISSALAPQLIIARVLSGSSWSSDSTRQIEDMEVTLDFSAASNPSQSPSNIHYVSTPDLSHASSSIVINPR